MLLGGTRELLFLVFETILFFLRQTQASPAIVRLVVILVVPRGLDAGAVEEKPRELLLQVLLILYHVHLGGGFALYRPGCLLLLFLLIIQFSGGL